MSQPDEFAGKRVTVMGLGRFGGGVGVTRFLADRGADVLVTDRDPADKLEQSLEQIRDLIDSGQVSLRLGEHNVSDFTTCDLVVVNPAVKPGNRFVRAAEAAGIEVTTEMRLLVQRLPNRLRTIGVTGSAGKSTVTAMIGHVLNKVFSAAPRGAGSDSVSPKVWVGGNIGVSLLPVIDQIGEDDWVVLELSSFMLERLKQDAHFRGWSPHIAVITNISPNHLDWHGSMEEYVASKKVILQYQQPTDHAVLSEQLVTLLNPNAPPFQLPKYLGSKVSSPSVVAGTYPIETFLSDWLQLKYVWGTHNRINAHLTCSACMDVFLSPDDSGSYFESEAHRELIQTIYEAISDFPGLPHRLQLVAEHNGVRYFNDSKCTTPEAAMLAVRAFVDDVDKPGDLPGVHLILGGYDKGSDLSALAELAASHCKAVYTIGATGDAIANQIEAIVSDVPPARPNSCGGASWPAAAAEVVRCGELDRAVDAIQERVAPGDVVLLSPACASWDQFENYEQRGQRFIELVKQGLDEPRP